MLGQQPISSGLCVDLRLLQQRELVGGCVGTGHWCAWSQSSRGLRARWSTCTRGGISRPSGQWVSGDTHWIFLFWFAPVQMLPAMNWVKCVWHSGHLLQDHVYSWKGGRESRLDAFPTSGEESHNRQQSWHASTGRCRGKNCGSVAIDCFVPEGDRPKRWRRQFYDKISLFEL